MPTFEWLIQVVFPEEIWLFIPQDPLIVYSFSSKDGDLRMFFPIHPCMLIGVVLCKPFRMQPYESIWMRHHCLVQKTLFYSSAHGSLAITIPLPPRPSSMFSGLGCRGHVTDTPFGAEHFSLFSVLWFSVIASKHFFEEECTCPWVWGQVFGRQLDIPLIY